MAVGKRSKGMPSIITAVDPAAALAALCPDLDQWPQRWRCDDSDLPCSHQLVALFTPFLLALIAQGLARKTLVRHRDHLWMLGGEIVRHRYEDRHLRRRPVPDVLRQLIDDAGGPMLSSAFSPTDQAPFDATCRKLHRFLVEQSAAEARGT